MTKIIKLSFCDELRRVPIGAEGKPEDYDDLLNAIRVTFPATDGATLTVTWKDEDGDTITMSSHAEFAEAMKCMSKGVPKFLVTAKTNPPTRENPASQAPSSNPAPKNNTVHDDVECDGCGMHPIIGVRYKSTFRENYDLCEKCESTLKPTEPMAKLTTKADASTPSFAPAALLNNTLGQVASTLDSLLQNKEASQAWQRCSTTTAPFVSAVDQMCSRWSGVRSSQPPQPCAPKPALKFLRDECLSDGTQVTPGASFLKGWLVCNDGKTAWPEGCELYTAGGDALLAVDYVPPGTTGAAGTAGPTHSCGAATPSENKEVLVGEPISPPLTAGEERVLYVLLTAPMQPGRYVAYFRMKTAEGRRFGHRLWADIVVVAPEQGVSTPASPAQGLCDDSSVSSVSDTLSPISESFNHLDTVNNVSTTTSAPFKRVRSPYILFCNEQRPKLRVSHPNASFGETGKLLGEMWYALDDQAKAAYGWAPGCAAATNTTTNTTAAPTTTATTTEQAPANTPPPTPSPSTEVEFSAAPPLYWHQELAILAEMGFEDIDTLVPLLKKFVKHPAGVAGGAQGVSDGVGGVGGVSGSGVSGDGGVSGGVSGGGGCGGEVSGEGTHGVSASSVEEKQRVAQGLQQVLACLLGTRVTEVYI